MSKKTFAPRSVNYLLYGWTLSTMDPEQVSPQRRRHNLSLAEEILSPFYLLFTLWTLNFIGSAPWASPRRRISTLRLAEEIFSPLFLLFTLWTWNFIESAPWASPRLRRPTLRLADNFFLPFYLLLTLWMCYGCENFILTVNPEKILPVEGDSP